MRIDFDALTASRIPLRVLAADVESGETVSLERFESYPDLVRAMHAGSRMPLISGRAVTYRGRLLWDAGLLDRYALLTALADGCTHLLILRSEPEGVASRIGYLFERYVVLPYVFARAPKLGRRYRRILEPKWNGLALIARSRSHPQTAPFLYDIQMPPSGPLLWALENRYDRLFRGAVTGAAAALQTFGVPVASLDALGETIRVAGLRQERSSL
jgi:hypothetical protein